MRNISLILFLCASLYCRAQIVVDTDAYTVEQLVRNVLINSNCAETSNYSSFTGTDQGVNGIGYFNANGSDFQFQEGIILSTGNAIDSQGPNNNQYNTHPADWLGDDDLSLVTETDNLLNASFIQFDFVPKSNNISFNFLFASEEYDDNYQCTFSDVFAFILTGPDGESTNMALIPDTNEPVSATSIRPGIPDLCEPANDDYFFGINGVNSPISQYGQTIGLTASSEVVPFSTYTIKLVIADNLDAELDSAVYLEAASFSIDVSLGVDRTVLGGNPLCDGETMTLDALSQGAQDYFWYRNGIELKNERNSPAITVENDGVYSVKIVFSVNCFSNGTIALEYIARPLIAQEPIDLTVCTMDNNGDTVFDFSQNGNRILGNQDPNIYQISYYKGYDDAVNDESKISGTDYSSGRSNELIYARVSSIGDCFVITSFEINVQQIDFSSQLEETYMLCLDADGNPKTPYPILNTGLSMNDNEFQWYRDSFSDENLIVGATQYSYTAKEEGKFVVLVRLSKFGCEITLSTMVNTSIPPESISVNLVSELFSANSIVEIQVVGSGEYFYSLDDGSTQLSSRFSSVGPGEHTALVSDIYGCSTVTTDFFIIDYPRFFTPNGDGSNDTWSVVGLSEIEEPEINIYDRYGKLIYHMFDSDWDGMLNGRPLPSSDYWFRLSYAMNGGRKEFKGHFSLKR